MAKEKAKGGPQPAQRLPGAEDACISQEQLETWNGIRQGEVPQEPARRRG